MTAARNLRTGGRRYCIWTDHEDALARNLEIPMAELAESLGRTANSIYRRRLILEVEGRHLDGRAARTKDPPLLGRPKRKCSACGRMFQPTIRRRMLCSVCYSGGDGGPMAA